LVKQLPLITWLLQAELAVAVVSAAAAVPAVIVNLLLNT
jgi:hypothetical protein